MEFTTLDLCLFGDGGGDGATAASGTTDTPAAGGEVLLGKAPPDQREAQQETEAPQQDTPEPNPEPTFDELIRGKYKQEYQQRTQQLIDTRFKSHRQQMEALQPILTTLGTRYGLDPASKDFAQQLMQRVSGDDALLEDEADRQGMTVDQLRTQQADRAELAALRSFKASLDAQQAVAGIQQQWQQEAAELAQMYPGFDLDSEVNGPNGEQLLSMLRSGVPMSNAYKALHMDELLPGAIKQAVETTQQRTVDNIRARGLRPDEAAAGGQARATQVRAADPAQWTPQQMAEAIEQARLGKKIYL